jgi:hypothetical protein
MHHMPTSIRLSVDEQEQLRKKSIEINKMLIKAGLEPLKDSELVHKILNKSISYATVGRSGEIVLDVP